MRRFSVAALLALAAVPAAAAHLIVTPGLLESGQQTTLHIELPAFRPGRQPSALEVSGDGLRMLSSRPARRIGQESRFVVRVRVDAPPGPLRLRLHVRYADGRSVDAVQTATVVPAAASTSSSHVAVWAVGGVICILVSAALLVGWRSLRRL